MRCKCNYCNKVADIILAPVSASKVVKVKDQDRKNYLRSDYEVINYLEDGLYCSYCGHKGKETDFEEIETWGEKNEEQTPENS